MSSLVMLWMGTMPASGPAGLIVNFTSGGSGSLGCGFSVPFAARACGYVRGAPRSRVEGSSVEERADLVFTSDDTHQAPTAAMRPRSKNERIGIVISGFAFLSDA